MHSSTCVFIINVIICAWRAIWGICKWPPMPSSGNEGKKLVLEAERGHSELENMQTIKVEQSAFDSPEVNRPWNGHLNMDTTGRQAPILNAQTCVGSWNSG